MDGAIVADAWEDAAKQFKPSATPTSGAPATGGNDDWKLWQQNGNQQDTSQEKPWIGQPRPENEGLISSIFHAPAYGVQDIGTGIKHLGESGKRMQGAHEVISGVGRASIPFIAPAVAAYGAVPVATGLAGGAVGSAVGNIGSRMLGADEDTANLVGDMGGIAGGIGAPRVPFRALGGKALDIMPETDPAIRSAAGVFSPRLRNVLDFIDRAKTARTAYQENQSVPAAPAPAPPQTQPQQPLPASRQLGPSIHNMPPMADTSGPIAGRSPTILQQEPKPQTVIPPSRQLGAGPKVIQMPQATDTSGPIPFTPPESWSAQPAKPVAQITNPKSAATPTITVPAAGAADVVERVEHPPFAPDRPFPISQKMREQTPAPTPPARADYEARVARLKSAFPGETDQQIRARADEAIRNKKMDANGGAGRTAAEALRQSMGAK